jgi:dGTPase
MAADWMGSPTQRPRGARSPVLASGGHRVDGMRERTDRQRAWASTMQGTGHDRGIVLAHGDRPPAPLDPRAVPRAAREEQEAEDLAPGATRAVGAGERAVEEEPDPFRTCFERDRDRILHASAFRRLAGKTQVFVFPADHQRTRLTHALEVAQVATSIARAVGCNVALTEAIALGHDCGHGPGGHASEDAFDHYLPGGYHHAVWGADVVLRPLNLCVQTLDGIRNHSWSRPTPATPEGAIVSWADRIAYCAHDLEDAVSAGVVGLDDLPPDVVELLGRTRREQLHALIGAVVGCIGRTGTVGMDADHAAALAALRAFNYERIYTRPASMEQADRVIAVLRALVEHFTQHPEELTDESAEQDPVRTAVAYVAGMTDRFAFTTAVERIGWPVERLPRGIDSGRT